MIIKNREDLTKIIKAACAIQGENVEGLGRRLGVLGPSISRTVNRSDLRLSQIMAIAAALGCDLDISITPTTKRDSGQNTSL